MWSAELGERLRHLREQHGIEAFSFARLRCISERQLRELEVGGRGCFYSEEIKYRVGMRLLHSLCPETEVSGS
jgi:hypothetical protein